jgi:DNA-binding MarR family transcriptional regulator
VGGKLAEEIQQSKPFSSLAEEAILNIYRTASVLDQLFSEALKPYGLSETQYNVLRILRGAGPRGLACQEIAARMIARDPDITRLLDRIESRGLISRGRSEEDRRVVVSRITAEGTKILSLLEPAARNLPKKILGHLGDRQLRDLIALLEQAREQK